MDDSDSVACVKHSKNQDTIVDAVLKTWLYVLDNHRYSWQIMVENFPMNSMIACVKYIEMAKTAAESPWSNGLCLRHKGVIEESIR